MNLRFDRRFVIPVSATMFFVAAAWVRPGPPVAVLPLERPTEIERIYAPFDTLRTDLTDYRWPVPHGFVTTSVFGDYRSTHFHGGVDVSTQGREGIPVSAMRDGWVSNVRISPHGYGNVIEVIHGDGFSTWYAHLRNFAGDLDSLIAGEQLAEGSTSATLRFAPNERPVKRGDVIAFSGRTGSGGPHLHFEIRDAEGNPVNPLLAEDIGRHAADGEAPIFEELGVVPLSAGTMIGNDSRPVYVRPRGIRNASVGSTITFAGKAGLTVRLRDGVGSRGFRNRTASVELFVDGVSHYVASISRVPSAESKQIALHYDWAARSHGHPYHQKLFVDQGNRLPFYARLPYGAGMLDGEALGEGSHVVEVVARDLNGNTSRLRATVRVTIPPAPVARITTANDPLTPSVNPITVEPEFYRDHVYLRLRSVRPLVEIPRVVVRAEGDIPVPEVHRLTSRQFFATFPLTPHVGRSLSIVVAKDEPSLRYAEPTEISLVAVTPESGGIAELPDRSFQLSFPTAGVFSELYVRLREADGAVHVLPSDVLLDEGADVEMRVPDELLSKRVGLFLSSDGDLQMLDWREPFGRTKLEGHVGRFLGRFEILEDETPPTLERRYLSATSSSLHAEFRISDRRAGVASSTIHATVDDRPAIVAYDPERHLISIDQRLPLAKGSHRLTVRARDKMQNEVVWEGSFVKK